MSVEISKNIYNMSAKMSRKHTTCHAKSQKNIQHVTHNSTTYKTSQAKSIKQIQHVTKILNTYSTCQPKSQQHIQHVRQNFNKVCNKSGKITKTYTICQTNSHHMYNMSEQVLKHIQHVCHKF